MKKSNPTAADVALAQPQTDVAQSNAATVAEAAQKFRVCTRTVRRMIDAGTLRAVRVGSKAIRIPNSEIARILSSDARTAAE